MCYDETENMGAEEISDNTESSTRELIRRFVGGGVRDEHELDHLFRVLSKRLHPDLAGGNGSRFIRLREMYEQAKRELRARTIAVRTGDFTEDPSSAASDLFQRVYRSSFNGSHPRSAGASQNFDPYFIVEEAGFGRDLDARGCLYLSLRRFYSLGLHNYRIRSMKGLKSRNAKVMRSIFHWSYIYDPAFPPIFAAYTRQHLQFLSTTWEVKNYNYARRLYSDGISGFFNYQYSGRRGTAEVAADKLSLSERILLRCVEEDHPLVSLSKWFADELRKKPAFLAR